MSFWINILVITGQCCLPMIMLHSGHSWKSHKMTFRVCVCGGAAPVPQPGPCTSAGLKPPSQGEPFSSSVWVWQGWRSRDHISPFSKVYVEALETLLPVLAVACSWLYLLLRVYSPGLLWARLPCAQWAQITHSGTPNVSCCPCNSSWALLREVCVALPGRGVTRLNRNWWFQGAVP